MELRHLYDTVERYVGDPVFVRPYGEVEGIGFGRGEGVATGERVSGTIAWTNHPRLREDDVWCPNLTGRLTTEDGADILYRLEGYSVRRPDGDGRDITASCRFTTDDDGLGWLNAVIGVAEGHIAADAVHIEMRVHECIGGAD